MAEPRTYWPGYPFREIDPPGSNALAIVVSDPDFSACRNIVSTFGKPHQPTEEEIGVMRRCFPDDDAANPIWSKVLGICVGQRPEWLPSEFPRLSASAVVVILRETLGKPSGKEIPRRNSKNSPLLNAYDAEPDTLDDDSRRANAVAKYMKTHPHDSRTKSRLRDALRRAISGRNQSKSSRK